MTSVPYERSRTGTIKHKQSNDAFIPARPAPAPPALTSGLNQYKYQQDSLTSPDRHQSSSGFSSVEPITNYQSSTTDTATTGRSFKAVFTNVVSTISGKIFFSIPKSNQL